MALIHAKTKPEGFWGEWIQIQAQDLIVMTVAS